MDWPLPGLKAYQRLRGLETTCPCHSMIHTTLPPSCRNTTHRALFQDGIQVGKVASIPQVCRELLDVELLGEERAELLSQYREEVRFSVEEKMRDPGLICYTAHTCLASCLVCLSLQQTRYQVRFTHKLKHLEPSKQTSKQRSCRFR